TATDVLAALGSLKFTVGLFAASLIIVLVGTLAQDELNMQQVKERYFVSWIAWMHFDDFLPQAFFPHNNPIRGVVPFPGGAMIGVLLMVNLIASKSTRFKVSASGSQLTAGIMFIIAGFVVAGLIIASGHNSDGLQGAPPISYESLWYVVQGVGIAGAIALAIVSANVKHRSLRIMGFIGAAVLASVIGYTLFSGARIGDPGLRIVWQLTKGLGAGLILLVGCLLIFGRQGGNLLLHFGVGLLMFGQFAFGDRQLEQRISLVEGQSTNALINLDMVELTFIVSEDDEDTVTAVPGSQLEEAYESGEVIRNEALPADIKVLAYFENSDIAPVVPGEENLATAGIGLEKKAVKKRSSGGTDSTVNIASAYVQLIDKDSGKPLGTHLVSQELSDVETLMAVGSFKDTYDSVKFGETDYKLGLKYRREVKPYWVHLEDVQRRNYSGTDTPRDYSSYIRIIDPETGEDRRERVWMNNPLRYRGETFFQSSYTPLPNGKEMTGLQVVRNSGWLIPYVACSIMALGMLAHFTGTLKRFVGRRERERVKEFAALSSDDQRRMTSSNPTIIAISVAAVFALMLLVPWPAAMISMGMKSRDNGYDFYTAGKIPTQFGGRILPLDAFARQTLKAISNQESLSVENSPGAIQKRVGGKKMSAIQWLMEVALDDESLRYLPMFRIDAEEVRSQLKLERRESRLYSLNELREEWEKADALIVVARKKDIADQSFKEKKLLELDRRTRQYMLTAESFQYPWPQDLSMDELPEGITPEVFHRFLIEQLQPKMQYLQSMPTARIVPPSKEEAADSVGDPDWSAFAPAFVADAAANGPAAEDDAPTASTPFSEMIKAYGDEKKDYEGFNKAVDDQLALSKAYPIAGFTAPKVGLERWMESNSPEIRVMILYIVALVMGLVFLATGAHQLRNATWGVLLVAGLIHSVAILSRIYITGRAPVINIYSSAVFIGWAGVLGGLVIDRIFRLGFGNLLAATAGTLSLLVAQGLVVGDTMPVLQAVLDTQFWLATHVISVSLGYVATMVAGLLGIGYLISNWLGKDESAGRSLYRMIYGAACFGILFSTVGTILGGLWADDSWGRFWGWDPKENGALLIVIWNALMLHARWDGMVKARGFAILAIGGNIVTAWSWFGTNELGIGLHSYGFTEGVLMWLTIFIASQFAFLIGGLSYWRKPSGV
ncbi:MAG: cytochrome c biogenesis protein CcsA, partial [Planctomycetales bacterium]|nr:cytochrome c biogenesis protein CcsA [Planctomycetales bacterium]